MVFATTLMSFTTTLAKRRFLCLPVSYFCCEKEFE